MKNKCKLKSWGTKFIKTNGIKRQLMRKPAKQAIFSYFSFAAQAVMSQWRHAQT
jgi:hypothetical protein